MTFPAKNKFLIFISAMAPVAARRYFGWKNEIYERVDKLIDELGIRQPFRVPKETSTALSTLKLSSKPRVRITNRSSAYNLIQLLIQNNLLYLNYTWIWYN